MWTEQTIETLRKLALEGRSAAWIAAALGAPSRNAVIGKANRIGIKLNGARSSPFEEKPGVEMVAKIPWERRRGRRAADASRPDRAQLANVPWRKSVVRARSGLPAVVREKRRTDRSTFATAVVGEMRRVGFLEINEVECRWPLGDPLQDDFAYCGLQVAKGHAYCAGHCRLAYRTPGAENASQSMPRRLALAAAPTRTAVMAE